MTSFLAAQAEAPFDPAPLLILADHLEEQGDVTAAEALRGLAACGIPSLHALALEATLCPAPFSPDLFRYGQGFGPEIERGDGSGFGSGDGSSYRRGAAGLGGEDGVSSPERIAMGAGQQLGLPA